MPLSSKGLQRELSSWNCSRRAISRASRLHGRCPGNATTMSPAEGELVDSPAHPRRRCSPVSRESNGRPLVKMLLFAYASRGSPRGPRSFIKFSVALDSDGVCVKKKRGKIAAGHTLLQGVKRDYCYSFGLPLFYLSVAVRQDSSLHTFDDL